MLHDVAAVFDVDELVGTVRARLDDLADEALVVLLRREGGTVYRYSFRARDLRARLAGAPAVVALRPVLGLHEYESAPVYEVTRSTASELDQAEGILVHENEIVGILTPAAAPVPAFASAVEEAAAEPFPVDARFHFDVLSPPGEAAAPPPPASPPTRRRRTKPPARVVRRPRAKGRAPGRKGKDDRRKRADRGGRESAAEPPRTAYARVECPPAVVAGEAFDLVVGLAGKPAAGVVGPPLVRPPWSIGAYTLTIRIVADGFTLATGESWEQRLQVTGADPYPTVPMRLTAARPGRPVEARVIRAFFAVSGHVMGLAVRFLSVAQDRQALVEAPPQAREASSATLTLPAAPAAPDLTVLIGHDPWQPGALVWAFTTRFDDVVLPEDAPRTNVGSAPQDFARQLMQQVNKEEGAPGLYDMILGAGRTVAEHVPAEFWAVLRAVAGKVNEPPSILILSEDPYVPWELAVVPDPPIDPSVPPFLGAQANVGRWVLGELRPKLPPPPLVEVSAMAVVSGVYDRPGWRRLEAAEREAADLRTAYGAEPVGADMLQLLKCLKGNPAAEVLHFAVHGQYDPRGLQDGLVLTDGRFLNPMHVRGQDLSRTPFVFLNACQVGQGQKILGDYAGLAEAFLYAGAGAVVAPLWSIKDDIARTLALEFYTRVFAGSSAASVLRAARGRFTDLPKTDGPAQSATWLAYQFFGHPAFTLRRMVS